MSGRDFDPTAARALIAESKDIRSHQTAFESRLGSLHPNVVDCLRNLADSLESAISAIGPSGDGDGGEIERVTKWLDDLAALVLKDLVFAENLREASALIRRLASKTSGDGGC